MKNRALYVLPIFLSYADGASVTTVSMTTEDALAAVTEASLQIQTAIEMMSIDELLQGLDAIPQLTVDQILQSLDVSSPLAVAKDQLGIAVGFPLEDDYAA